MEPGKTLLKKALQLIAAHAVVSGITGGRGVERALIYDPGRMRAKPEATRMRRSPSRSDRHAGDKRGRALFAGSEHGDIDDHEARAVDAMGGAFEPLEAAMSIGPAGQAVVGATHDRDAILDGAEDGGGGVLPLRGAFAKPAVVGEVHQKNPCRQRTYSRARWGKMSSKQISTETFKFKLSRWNGTGPRHRE